MQEIIRMQIMYLKSERAEAGTDLDILEQLAINGYGGPMRYGGTLENKRNQIAEHYWNYYDIEYPDYY